jgi:hypothetical protein
MENKDLKPPTSQGGFISKLQPAVQDISSLGLLGL